MARACPFARHILKAIGRSLAPDIHRSRRDFPKQRKSVSHTPGHRVPQWGGGSARGPRLRFAMEDRLKATQDDEGDLTVTTYGNGHEGLKTKVDRLEQHRNSASKYYGWVATLVIAAIGSTVTVLVNHLLAAAWR